MRWTNPIPDCCLFVADWIFSSGMLQLGQRAIILQHLVLPHPPSFLIRAPWPAASPVRLRRQSSSSSKLSRRLLLILLFIGGTHPNPDPSSNPPAPPIGILQWNCNGIRSSAAELASFLDSRQVKVACLQETKLSSAAKTPSFPNYAVIRRDRPAGGGGGLMTLVHHSLSFVESPSPFSDFTEAIIAVDKLTAGNITVANLYVPPQSSCSPTFSASIAPLLNSDTIIVGDVNAHNELWSLGNNDARGDNFADQIDAKNFVVLNNADLCTRPSSNSSPDVAIVPPDLALSLSWEVSSTLNSDHFPVAINFDNDSPPQCSARNFTNFRRANWDAFKRETERLFADLPLPSSCSSGEKAWRRVIQKASAKSIPSGCESRK